MQIPLMLLQLKRPRNRMQTQCLFFFLLHVIKTYDQQPKVWFLFLAVFTPADFKTYVLHCKSWKIHNFFLFLKGTDSAGVSGFSGSCHRSTLQEGSRPQVTQYMQWPCSPTWLALVSSQNVCFILRQTKPLGKHKAKRGLKSQLC